MEKNESAVNNEENRENVERYIGQLEELMSWSDEVPQNIIQDGEFKVRKVWWNAVEAVLFNIRRNCELSTNFIDDIDRFSEVYFARGVGDQPTTKENIDDASRFLSSLIQELKSIYGHN